MNLWRPRILVLLAVTSIYLYGFPSATLTYSGVLLFHLGAGLALTILMVPYFVNCWREQKFANRLGWSLLALGAILGIVLIKIGTPHRLKNWLYAHIAFCVAGVFSICRIGVSNIPLKSSAGSWQPAHHFELFTPATSCMYSMLFRYH